MRLFDCLILFPIVRLRAKLETQTDVHRNGRVGRCEEILNPSCSHIGIGSDLPYVADSAWRKIIEAPKRFTVVAKIKNPHAFPVLTQCASQNGTSLAEHDFSVCLTMWVRLRYRWVVVRLMIDFSELSFFASSSVPLKVAKWRRLSSTSTELDQTCAQLVDHHTCTPYRTWTPEIIRFHLYILPREHF